MRKEKKTGYVMASSAFAALTAVGSSTALAQEGALTVYGSARMALNMQRTALGVETSQVTDMASRFGIRGFEKLSNDLEGVYSVEFGYAGDTVGAGTGLNNTRHAAVGLRSKTLGTLVFGGLDSGNPTGSPLHSQVLAIVSFAPGDVGPTAIGTSMLNSRNRTPNSIGYSSPNMFGFLARARYYYRGAGTTAEPESNLRSLDLGLSYQAGPWYAGVAFARDSRAGGLRNNEFEDKFHIGVRYNHPLIQPYAIAGVDNFVGTATTRDEVQWWLVGARVPFGPKHSVVANYGVREVQTNLVGERKRTQLAYMFQASRRTQLSVYYDNDSVDSSRTGVAIRSIGTGIRHDF
jgi:predicted porin